MSDESKLPKYSSTEFPLNALNKEKKFYDLENTMNPLHYRVRPNSKQEFGLEYETVVPPEGEVRLLGNRHKDCRYYSLGKLIIIYNDIYFRSAIL
jgi:hypothetical protein